MLRDRPDRRNGGVRGGPAQLRHLDRSVRPRLSCSGRAGSAGPRPALRMLCRQRNPAQRRNGAAFASSACERSPHCGKRHAARLSAPPSVLEQRRRGQLRPVPAFAAKFAAVLAGNATRLSTCPFTLTGPRSGTTPPPRFCSARQTVHSPPSTAQISFRSVPCSTRADGLPRRMRYGTSCWPSPARAIARACRTRTSRPATRALDRTPRPTGRAVPSDGASLVRSGIWA